MTINLKRILKNTSFLTIAISIVACLSFSEKGFSQVTSADVSMPRPSSSKSRTMGGGVDFNSFDSLKRIRSMINKGENEEAANRLIKIIKQEESGRSDGIESDRLAVLYNELCLSTTNLRKVEYAMGACNKSLELTPDHWESFKSRATLHFMTSNFPEALADFKMSLVNAPENDVLEKALKQNIAVVESKIPNN
ncbi:MAG: hypothetical protein HOH19_11025 [Kordiimonadaceae bacterium]|jgi:hypothetical protein|nr:hypothetical protein [Kordiimonadaceae bacterium]MBT6033100.1 hypothetical protein [Kordiimonadaceae bacterium]